jgi:hypothetical protein
MQLLIKYGGGTFHLKATGCAFNSNCALMGLLHRSLTSSHKSYHSQTSVQQNSNANSSEKAQSVDNQDWELPAWIFKGGYFARPIPVADAKSPTREYFSRFLVATPPRITSPFEYATGGGGKQEYVHNWIKLLYLGFIGILLNILAWECIKDFNKKDDTMTSEEKKKGAS